jgi:hypothetical protein
MWTWWYMAMWLIKISRLVFASISMVISTLIQFENVGGSFKHYNIWGIGCLGLIVIVIKIKQKKGSPS